MRRGHAFILSQLLCIVKYRGGDGAWRPGAVEREQVAADSAPETTPAAPPHSNRKRTSTDRRRRAARWVRLRLLCGGAAGVVSGALSAATCSRSTAPGRWVPVPRPAGGWPAPGPAAGAVGMPTSVPPGAGAGPVGAKHFHILISMELLFDLLGYEDGWCWPAFGR